MTRQTKKTKTRPQRPIFTVTQMIRRVLLQNATVDSPCYKSEFWPTPSDYARWCNCSPQTIRNFAFGKTTSIKHEILNNLAVLTGVYPVVTQAERIRRTRYAQVWSWTPYLKEEYWQVRDYVLAMEAEDKTSNASTGKEDHGQFQGSPPRTSDQRAESSRLAAGASYSRPQGNEDK